MHGATINIKIKCKPNFQSVFQRKMRAHGHLKSRMLRYLETSGSDYTSIQIHPRRTEYSTTPLRKPRKSNGRSFHAGQTALTEHPIVTDVRIITNIPGEITMSRYIE